jgi:hypothetical protein
MWWWGTHGSGHKSPPNPPMAGHETLHPHGCMWLAPNMATRTCQVAPKCQGATFGPCFGGTTCLGMGIQRCQPLAMGVGSWSMALVWAAMVVPPLFGWWQVGCLCGCELLFLAKRISIGGGGHRTYARTGEGSTKVRLRLPAPTGKARRVSCSMIKYPSGLQWCGAARGVLWMNIRQIYFLVGSC